MIGGRDRTGAALTRTVVTSTESVIKCLCEDYAVSFETAAWQIKNSVRLSDVDEDVLQPYLKSLWATF
jgi:hypothetical protein